MSKFITWATFIVAMLAIPLLAVAAVFMLPVWAQIVIALIFFAEWRLGCVLKRNFLFSKFYGWRKELITFRGDKGMALMSDFAEKYRIPEFKTKRDSSGVPFMSVWRSDRASVAAVKVGDCTFVFTRSAPNFGFAIDKLKELAS